MKMGISAKVCKKVKSACKDPYLDLLAAHELVKSQRTSGLQVLHEGGFELMYKLMAREPVECHSCLEVRSILMRK